MVFVGNLMNVISDTNRMVVGFSHLLVEFNRYLRAYRCSSMHINLSMSLVNALKENVFNKDLNPSH